MCPADDSHLTLEFNDHFIIRPSIVYFSRKNHFNENKLGEKGIPVSQGFEYSSGTNTHFLDVESIKTYNKAL
jgi:UDP-N-acetylglucosamine 4,6-dehydratase